jgi:hypothetical protein
MTHTPVALVNPSQLMRRQFIAGSAKSGLALTALSVAA